MRWRPHGGRALRGRRRPRPDVRRRRASRSAGARRTATASASTRGRAARRSSPASSAAARRTPPPTASASCERPPAATSIAASARTASPSSGSATRPRSPTPSSARPAAGSPPAPPWLTATRRWPPCAAPTRRAGGEFGRRGRTVIRLLQGSIANDVVMEDERPVLVGQAATDVGGYAFATVRLTATGRRDPDFSGDGVAIVRWPEYPIARATAGALQRGGRLVTVGIGCVGGTDARCTGGTARLLIARQLLGMDRTAPAIRVGRLGRHITVRRLRRLSLPVGLSEPGRLTAQLLSGRRLLWAARVAIPAITSSSTSPPGGRCWPTCEATASGSSCAPRTSRATPPPAASRSGCGVGGRSGYGAARWPAAPRSSPPSAPRRATRRRWCG